MDGKRQDLLKQIELKRQSLQQALQHLLDERKSVEETLIQSAAFEKQRLELIPPKIEKLQEELAQAETLQEDIQDLVALRSTLMSENNTLRDKMNELKERQIQVAKVEGAQCPFCEQELSPQHRQSLIEKLELEGKGMAEQWHDNRQKFQEADIALKDKNQALQTRGQTKATCKPLSAKQTGWNSCLFKTSRKRRPSKAILRQNSRAQSELKMKPSCPKRAWKSRKSSRNLPRWVITLKPMPPPDAMNS